MPARLYCSNNGMSRNKINDLKEKYFLKLIKARF